VNANTIGALITVSGPSIHQLIASVPAPTTRRRPEEQFALVDLAGQVLLRQRRAVLGEMTLGAENADRPAVAVASEGLGRVLGHEARADDQDPGLAVLDVSRISHASQHRRRR
jgi:hypothetical protein